MKPLSILFALMTFFPLVASAAGPASSPEKFDCTLYRSHATAEDKFGVASYQQSEIDRTKPNVMSLSSKGYSCQGTLDTASLTWNVTVTGPDSTTKTDTESVSWMNHTSSVMIDLANGDQGVCLCDAYQMNLPVSEIK